MERQHLHAIHSRTIAAGVVTASLHSCLMCSLDCPQIYPSHPGRASGRFPGCCGLLEGRTVPYLSFCTRSHFLAQGWTYITRSENTRWTNWIEPRDRAHLVFDFVLWLKRMLRNKEKLCWAHIRGGLLNIFDMGLDLFGLGEEFVFAVCFFQIGVLMASGRLMNDDHKVKRQRKLCKAPVHLGC